MFLKTIKNSAKIPTFPKYVASSFHTSLPSQYSLPKTTIDSTLLSPFDKSKTFQALNQVHQATLIQKDIFNPINIRILDKTGSTSYSQTFRAYDKESNILFAQKKLYLDSDSSWNQLNLILKHYTVQYSHLASIYSINFYEKNQEVNVISQANQNTMGDYSQWMAKQDRKWTDELLISYIQQISFQMRVLRLINAHCEGPVKPQNIFLDDKSHNLKLFDLSDFQIGAENLKRNRHENSDFLNSSLQTLMQILNPEVPVSSIEEAKSYLSRYHPSFYKMIQENLTLTFYAETHPLVISRDYDAFICRKLGLPVANENKNMTEKEQEGLEYWRKFKENGEPGYLIRMKVRNLVGNQDYERLLTLKERILSSYAAYMIKIYVGMFLLFIIIFGSVWAGITIFATVLDSILQKIINIASFFFATAAKEENNLDQNDGKTE